MEYPFKDLLPLDEVLERGGYYKDWTHLDPEVFYSLTQISEYIKTKGYGVDVRLLIAQLAEHFGLKTTQVVDLANLLQQKFTNLEGVTQRFTNNINSLVAQMEADKDAIIANVTEDSEVIDARSGKATLRDRLNSMEYFVNVSDFGAIGDGETDDTVALQTCFDSLKEGDTVYLNGNYKISESLYIRQSKIKIEGNNSKLLWYGSTEYDGGNLGKACLMIEGSLTTETGSIISADTQSTLKLTLIDAGLFNVGDAVHVRINQQSWDNSYLDFKPSLSVLTTVLAKDGNTLTVDHTVPYNFTGEITGVVTKVNVISNIEVKDLHYSDENKEVNEDDSSPWVSGIQFRYANGLRVINFSARQHKVKGLRIVNSRNFYVQDCHFENPQTVIPDCGYGVQVAASTKGYFLKVTGFNNRHLIDFSGSSHCHVVQSQDFTSPFNAFDCHGLSEHDIVFEKCEGSIVLGNSIREFPSTTQNITINQCKLDGFYFGFVHGLQIIDSDIIESGTGVYQNFGDVHIVRSKIKLMTPKTLTMRNRGFIEGEFLLENSELYLEGTLTMVDFKNIKIIQSKIETSSYKNIAFNNITKVSINGNFIKNTILYLKNATKEINVRDNEFVSNHENSSSLRMIGLTQSNTNTPSVVTFANNRIFGVTQSTWIRTADTPFSGSIWRFIDNTFEGKIGEVITNYTELDDVKRLSRGNVNQSTLSGSYLMTFEN